MHDPDYLQWIFFCIYYRQSTISQQILETFGQCQNCQNQTFKWLYQLYKTMLEKYFFVKKFTMMLLYMYQVFSSLRSHLHFFVHFFFSFMEYFFFGHPISCQFRTLIRITRAVALQTFTCLNLFQTRPPPSHIPASSSGMSFQTVLN